MITSIQFRNYKALEHFSVSLKKMNILVGPNNSGKSSILDAFRILNGAYRFASRRTPSRVALPDGRSVLGYAIPEASIPIAVEHIHTNYNDEPTVISYRLESGNKLHITFNQGGQITLHYDTDAGLLRTSTAFRSAFPIKLYVIPSLGTLEHEEALLNPDYVALWSSSHRGSRMFRNTWFHDSTGFDDFKRLVEDTWPGMSISRPEYNSDERRLIMFCSENRMDREVFWAGSGFQIWLQLLTHIVRAQQSGILVVDEPEIYLHPDLQRRISEVLRLIGCQVLLATHSVEIINDADLGEVLLVERRAASAKRLVDITGLQSAAVLLGSNHNIQLTRLARHRQVLFVEGNDHKLLKKIAAVCGHSLDQSLCVPLGGSTQWQKVMYAEWVFTDILGERLRAAVLLDRDYRYSEEVKEFVLQMATKVTLVHVLERKEIENYLLLPKVIEKAIVLQLEQRVARGLITSLPEFDTEDMLTRATQSFENDVFGQRVKNRAGYYQSKGKDIATVVAEENATFRDLWGDLNNRLSMVPGKETLSNLNVLLQGELGVSITHSGIVRCMSRRDVAADLAVFLDQVACTSTPSA